MTLPVAIRYRIRPIVVDLHPHFPMYCLPPRWKGVRQGGRASSPRWASARYGQEAAALIMGRNDERVLAEHWRQARPAPEPESTAATV
jgi:hypothetical protein